MNANDKLQFAGVAVVIGLLPLFFFNGTYEARLLTQFLVFAILVIGLNIVFGHTDQLFLFLGALAGTGTYITALLAQLLGVSAWVTLLIGAATAGLLGLIVSYIAAKRNFTVITIAVLTLALQLAFIEFISGARDITEGTTGFPFDGLTIGVLESALGLDPQLILYYTLAVLLIGTLTFYTWLINSRFGLAFDAIRQDEQAAESIGIDVVKYKTAAGCIGAGIIGLVGPFYAQAEGYVAPTMFAFQNIDVLVIIMLILGGIRTRYGPIVGAAAIIVLEQVLQQAGQWRLTLLGVLLVFLFLYFRSGIMPWVLTYANKARQRVGVPFSRT